MSTIVQEQAAVAVTVGRNEITFDSGELAKQADGAVVVRSGDTMVLATAMGRTEAREGADFFPLTVDVEERMYAAGKIPGGFFKREGRPTEKAILTARMIDRPIRPFWPKGFTNEVQVICTILSADLVTAHDILCLNGASAALQISPLPFAGPVGAVRIGLVDGELVVNPTLPEVEEESRLDLIVVGTREGLTMVEAGADEVPEETLLEAFELAHGEIRKLCDLQEELRSRVGKPKWIDPEVTQEIDAEHGDRVSQSIQLSGLREAAGTAEEIKGAISPELSMSSSEEDIVRETQVRASLDLILERKRLEAVLAPVRQQFESELRALTEAEQDSKQLKSAKRHLLFDRIIETVELPFPVGPATVEGDAPTVKDGLTRQFVKKAAESLYKELVRKKIAVEKRRPDGRGTEEIRHVSETLESNGSSSMGSVCGSTLALMDAGVPIKAPVSGIAMGLVKEGDDYVILTDIQGAEDHLGDMDFKVAGTREGITGLQMDIKITGVTQEIMRSALEQAKEARESILDTMLAVLPAPRSEMPGHAPRISTVKIDSEQIGLVIGKGGETIRALEADYEVQIDIEEDGMILVYSTSGDKAEAAISAITALTKSPEVGDNYTGRVVKTTQFGAFVELKKGTDGLL